jgi:uncharacterized membrane protein YcaP (DUF421 family)
VPDGLDHARHVALDGRGAHPAVRHIILLLLAVWSLLALEVQSPSRLRGGLIFQTRITIHARTRIAHPTLVLQHGWFESMSVNSIVPDTASQIERGRDAAPPLSRPWRRPHLDRLDLLPGQPVERRPPQRGRDARRRSGRADRRPPIGHGASLMDLVIRTTVIVLLVFALTRVVGRREPSTMEPFDVILLVVVGDLVQQGITQSDDSVTGTTIVLATVALLTVGLSYLSFRVPRLRPLLEGEPIVLVVDGEAIDRNLKRERLTLDDLLAEARTQQIGSLDDVRFAVRETGGKISFLTRSPEYPSGVEPHLHAHDRAVRLRADLDEIAHRVREPHAPTVQGIDRRPETSGQPVAHRPAVADLARHRPVLDPGAEDAGAAPVHHAVGRKLADTQDEFAGAGCREPRGVGALEHDPPHLREIADAERVLVHGPVRLGQPAVERLAREGARERRARTRLPAFAEHGVGALRLDEDVVRERRGVVGTQEPPGRAIVEGDVEQRLVPMALRQLGLAATGPDGLADAAQRPAQAPVRRDEVVPRRDDARGIASESLHLG